MGRDGSIGAQDVVAAGGEIAAQDRATSVVWGMPGSVATAGLASTVAAPAAIARRIAQRLEGSTYRRTSAWR
jgi:two-component system chemotaxis response regulator CheB